MRAIFINEVQSFKRGIDPYRTLKIGEEQQLINSIQHEDLNDLIVYHNGGKKELSEFIYEYGLSIEEEEKIIEGAIEHYQQLSQYLEFIDPTTLPNNGEGLDLVEISEALDDIYKAIKNVKSGR